MVCEADIVPVLAEGADALEQSGAVAAAGAAAGLPPDQATDEATDEATDQATDEATDQAAAVPAFVPGNAPVVVWAATPPGAAPPSGDARTPMAKYAPWASIIGALISVAGLALVSLVGWQVLSMNSQMSSLGDRIDGVRVEMNTKIDGLDTKIGKLDDKIDTKIDTKIGELRTEMQAGFRQVNATLLDHTERLTRLEERVTGVETRLTSVEERLDGVEERLTGVEERVTGVETRLTRVEERLTGVEGRLTRLETAAGISQPAEETPESEQGGPGL